MSVVTLTFDNGPTVETTPTVLEQLAARGLTATFCVVGTQLASAEQVDIASEALAAGHRLVNHSLTHGVALGDDPTPLHAQREVTEMNRLLDEKLGDWGERWFRPFGRGGQLGPHIFSDAALAQLTGLGYSVLLWNCVPRDWEDRDGWVETALDKIASQEHTVIVLHDLNTGAMNHLPRFLDLLAKRGDTIATTLPDDCVPMRNGTAVWQPAEFKALVAATP